jgi:hypothetical protein
MDLCTVNQNLYPHAPVHQLDAGRNAEPEAEAEESAHLREKVDPVHGRLAAVLENGGRVKEKGGSRNVDVVGVVLALHRGVAKQLVLLRRHLLLCLV